MDLAFVSTLLFLHFLAINGEPCFIEEAACQLDSTNLLGVHENISEISECKQLCKDTNNCAYFTHHQDKLVPSHYHTCYLLTYCTNTVPFPGSVSGFMGPCTCSLEVEPQDGIRIKDQYSETELGCKHICQEDPDCEIYSFHEPTKDCELLMNVSSYVKSSLSELHTGPGNCSSNSGMCTLALVRDNTHTMIENTTMHLIIKSGMLDCMVNMSMVVVGQGGKLANQTNMGGGGSGYVNTTLFSIKPSQFLDVIFDSDGSVYVYANNEIILEGLKGSDGTSEKGGDGYSGGGYRIADGGSGGEDGDCFGTDAHLCGKGQEIDIRQFSTEHFQLAPGEPGRGSSEGPGGGGGVLVYEQGPHDRLTRFGMGEGILNSFEQGCFLLDIIH